MLFPKYKIPVFIAIKKFGGRNLLGLLNQGMETGLTTIRKLKKILSAGGYLAYTITGCGIIFVGDVRGGFKAETDLSRF